MEQDKFIHTIQNIVENYMIKKGFFVHEWHLGLVSTVNIDNTLNVYIDGNTVVTPNVPCNPNYNFIAGDYVWVQYVNKNPNNLYIPSRRSIGDKRISSGGGTDISACTTDNLVEGTINKYMYIDDITSSTTSTFSSNKITSELVDKEDTSNKGIANGYAGLNADSVVPIIQLPSNIKELKVVSTITDRDNLSVYEGLRVHVLDATGDSSVLSGWAEYLYTGTVWGKTAEKESIDVVLDWFNIQNKPDVVTKSDTVLSLGNYTLQFNSSEDSLDFIHN